jgi:hypothetical protein
MSTSTPRRFTQYVEPRFRTGEEPQEDIPPHTPEHPQWERGPHGPSAGLAPAPSGRTAHAQAGRPAVEPGLLNELRTVFGKFGAQLDDMAGRIEALEKAKAPASAPTETKGGKGGKGGPAGGAPPP